MDGGERKQTPPSSAVTATVRGRRRVYDSMVGRIGENGGLLRWECKNSTINASSSIIINIIHSSSRSKISK